MVVLNLSSWVDINFSWAICIDLMRGERAANRVFELDPEATAPYITLSNLYFSAGRVDDALNVIKRMRQKGLVKQADGIPIEVLGERVSKG